jgi:hypothetical protein
MKISLKTKLKEIKMAKTTTTTTKAYNKPKVSRPGVHAKTKSSRSKNSKNYKKSYRAQGR